MELAEGPSGRLLTLEERKSYLLHNDEANQLQYNWALFHVFLILGSLSMMMGMTNFFRYINETVDKNALFRRHHNMNGSGDADSAAINSNCLFTLPLHFQTEC